MPTINIPPVVRFALYLLGAVALLFVAYAVDKSWAGDAEVRLVTGLAALLHLLAAAKTNLSSEAEDPNALGNAISKALNQSARRADRGQVPLNTIIGVLLVVFLVVVILSLL